MGYYWRYVRFELGRIALNWQIRVWWFKLLVFLLIACSIITAFFGSWLLFTISTITVILYVWRYC